MRSAPNTPWVHVPSSLTLVWLAVSLPLVIWDFTYMFLRPHSMPGGAYHWPLWVPYELYGRIDYVYGWKAYDAQSGFSGAQSFLNIVETLMYLYYVYIWYTQGKVVPTNGTRKVLTGRAAGEAVAVGFAAACMTVSKTVLYWLCEWFSNYENIGHNTARDVVILWIIPNGLWLIFPTFMIFELWEDIVGAFEVASSRVQKKE